MELQAMLHTKQVRQLKKALIWIISIIILMRSIHHFNELISMIISHGLMQIPINLMVSKLFAMHNHIKIIFNFIRSKRCKKTKANRGQQKK